MLDYQAPADSKDWIEVEVRSLRDPIDDFLSQKVKSSLFGFKRTRSCEVLLSEKVFR